MSCAPGAQNEVKLLLELLPRYAGHVEKHPHTLLVKFFGLYRVIPDNGAKVGLWSLMTPAPQRCSQEDCMPQLWLALGCYAWSLDTVADDNPQTSINWLATALHIKRLADEVWRHNTVHAATVSLGHITSLLSGRAVGYLFTAAAVLSPCCWLLLHALRVTCPADLARPTRRARRCASS